MQYLQFAGPHKQFLGAKVAAGPTSSVVIDRQAMYYVAGKVSFGLSFIVDMQPTLLPLSGKTLAMVGIHPGRGNISCR
jgi:hypothetical protein